jgi:hypothetical protein
MVKRSISVKVLLPTVILLLWFQDSIGQIKGLFDSEEILEITLKGDFKSLSKNISGEATYFDFSISYLDERLGEKTSIPLRIRTRGHFRREMKICDFPPILLNFTKEDVKNTLFQEQDKLKLVMPCAGEKYVVREYYVYKLYNLLTPKSFKVRLVRLNIEDQSDKPKEYEPILAFLLEEEEQMANRIQMTSFDKDFIQPQVIEPEEFQRMAVFQYLIGNTDWSVQYRQNIKLVHTPGHIDPIPVPYDFDHAGIVRAPYAKPAPELKLTSVTDRRYRGYCVEEMQNFEKTFLEFNSLKDSFYELYSKSKLLEASYIKSTLKFLDAFYTTINTPKRAVTDFQYPCREDGTGNVVIKGLK